MEDSLLKTSSVYGTEHYISCIRVLWCIRLLDFLELSMIMPTLQALLNLLGGSATYYYLALFLYTAVLMCCRKFVGLYADRTHNVLFLYRVLLAMSVLANSFYALSPSLGSPVMVVVARASCALGASTENLAFFYLKLVKDDPGEMRTWATRMATTRSIGYLGGPVLATLLLAPYPTGTQVTSSTNWSLLDWTKWQSPIGEFGIIGVALAVANLAMLFLLNIVWKDPPSKPKQAPPKDPLRTSGAGLPEEMSIRSFFMHWAVAAVVLGNSVGCFLGLGFENIIPLTTRSILGWGPHLARYNGFIYIAIGASLLLGQSGVAVITSKYAKVVSDGACFLFGLAGMSCGCAFIAMVWSTISPGDYTDPFGKDYSVTLMFVGPPLITGFFMPFCMNSSTALFVRLVSHSCGSKLGLAQAIQMNCVSLATLLIPAYQFVTYPPSMQESRQSPCLSIGLMSLLGFVVLSLGIAAKHIWGTG